MSYSSEIVIAISGTPEQIKQYVDHISTLPLEDEEQLFSLFKLIEVNKYCSVYFFHQKYFCWNESYDTFWKALRDQANIAGLAHVFYRLGCDFGEDETEEAGSNEGYLALLRKSITLHRSIAIDDVIAFKYEP